MKLFQSIADIQKLIDAGDRDMQFEVQLSRLILKAAGYEHDLGDSYRSASEKWQYREVQVDWESHDPGKVMSPEGGIFYIYRDQWMAVHWNIFRCARIILHTLIIECLELLDIMGSSVPWHDFKSEVVSRDKSCSIIRAMISDLCASIPFGLGEIDSTGALRVGSQKRGAGGYFLLFPLQTIIQSKLSDRTQSRLALSALRRIGNEFGIKMAFNVADPARSPGELRRLYP